MPKRLCWIAGLASVVMFVYAGTAGATTLGLTTKPAGATEGACTPGPPAPTLVQLTQDPTTPYFAPTSGLITQWQTNVTGDTIGAPVTFVVARPLSGGSYTVVGANSVTIPSNSGVATFTLANPITVQTGDTLGLYSTSTGVGCYFSGGSTPSGDNITALVDPSPPPSPGQTLTSTFPCGLCTMNVAATLAPLAEDAAVTTAGPSGASAGQAALLPSTVTNNGPGTTPITFTDVVPSGMTIDFAGAGNGTCSSSGQTVTCTISGLTTGQTAPVAVVVTPSSTGSYTNTVSVGVASGATDPNAANNSASAMFTVGLSLPAKCVVPNLKDVASGLAKTALKDLGCKVKTTKSHSKSVHKGSVVKTKPGKGTYAYQKTITLVVSSGPKKHK